MVPHDVRNGVPQDTDEPPCDDDDDWEVCEQEILSLDDSKFLHIVVHGMVFSEMDHTVPHAVAHDKAF